MSHSRRVLHEDQYILTEDLAFSWHSPEYENVWHSHDFFEVVICVDGCCENYFEGSSVRMRPGSVVIIPPKTAHCLNGTSKGGRILNMLVKASSFWQAFSPLLVYDDLAAGYFNKALYRQPDGGILTLENPRDSQLLYFVEHMLSQYEIGSVYRQRIMNNYFQLFVAFILRDYKDDLKILGGEPEDNRMFRILVYMNREYRELTLKQAARHFGYDEAYMSRLIKKKTGRTFSDLLREIRMKNAALLLGTTSANIDTVALSVGYSSTSVFQKNFKSYYGMTPGKYREQAEKVR